MNNKQEVILNTFRVRDLSVAAFLYSSEGITLQRTEKDKLGNVIFHFTPCDTSKQLVRAYWSLQAPLLQPKRILNSLRDLKDIIFNEK